MTQADEDALANTYVAIQQAAWDVPVEDAASLDAELRRITDEARAAWPGVAVDDQAFAAWLAERAPDETHPLEALASMHTSDLYLACGCAAGDEAAVRAFETSILPALEPAVARIDKDPAFIGRIRDDVRIRLLVDEDERPARIRSYIGRGPLTSWVQVAAIRAAYSVKRKTPKELPADLERLAAFPMPGNDQELLQIRAQFGGAFKEAFEASLRSLSARDRNVLRLHLLEGLNTETIGRMYKVHRATVARWIASIHATVLAETKKRLQQDHAIGRAEFDSLMRLLSSQLEVSIVSALR